jgi:hypothetical protein
MYAKMNKPFVILLLLICFSAGISAQPGNVQNSSEYDYSKNGILIFETFRNYENIKKSNPDLCKAHLDLVKAFVNELTSSSALLTEKRGFDLNVVANGYGNMNDQKNWEHKEFEYGIITELCFQFQLFFSKGGKWDHYCPNWCFKINAPLYGKSLPFQGLHSNIKVLNEVFLVFPHAKDIAPGVRFHYNDNGKGELVFFNPARPDYWLPVTLKEIVDARLKYTAENEKGVYEMMKAQAAKLDEAELNKPAYYGNSEEYFLLEVNGQKKGVPIMRFNPDYWDKSLPRSAIQYFTLNYEEILDEASWKSEREKFFNNNQGRIDYIQEAPCSITDFKKLSGVIQKK